MANPYSSPINYKYKPLDIGVLAQPLAQEQARYDKTMDVLDSTTFELKNLDPDSDRAKYLQKHLGDSVERISDNLLKSGDYRNAGRNLKKANKFYNTNEEIKAIQGNYSAWTKALKEQKKRVAKGDLTQKAFNEWKFRQTNEFKQSGGTGFTEDGTYTSIGTQGRIASKEKEIEEWALKLAQATPERKKVIYSQIQDVAGVDFKKALPKTLIEEKNLDNITRELYNTLSTSARFAPWLEDRADYSQYFSSRNPDGSTNVEWASKEYGKNLAIYNAELKKIDDSTTLNAKDKKAKKAIINAKLNELEEGYKNAKQGGMERFYKNAFTENYIANLSRTTADIVDYRNEIDNVKLFDDKAAMKAAKKADKLIEGLDVNYTKDSTGDLSVIPGLEQLNATLDTSGNFITITDPITGVVTPAGTNLMLDAVIGTGTSVDDQGNEIPATGLTAYSENISDLDSQINSIGTTQQQLYQNQSADPAEIEKLEVQKQTLINKKAQVATKQEQARGLITVATENAIRSQIEELEVANEDAGIYKAQLKEFNKVKNGSMNIEDFLKEQKELGQSIYNLDPRKASQDSGYEVLSIPSGGYDSEGDPIEFEKGTQSSVEKVYNEILEADKTQKRFNQNPTIIEFTLGGAKKSTERSLERRNQNDSDISIGLDLQLKTKSYPDININTNELKEKLDKLGYDLVEDTDRQSFSDKKTYLDNQTNRHYRAVPKNLIEDYDAYQLNNINKSNEKIARNIYDLQGDLGTNDMGVVVDEVSNELSGGELTRLTDFQKTDVQYTNTEVFERDDFGNYSMVEKASQDPKNFRPNLELYVPKNIVGTNEDGTPIIRWSLAERLTPAQVNAELDKLTPGQLGITSEEDSIRYLNLKTLNAEDKREYFKNRMNGDLALFDQWVERFNQDVFIGSTGTTFNTTSMLENATESLGTIMQNSSPTEKMSALNSVAQLDVALDNKKQKQLRSDFKSLELGAIDSLPFKQGTPFTMLNNSGKEEVFYYELGYESSNGAIIPIINLKNTNGESIDSDKLDDIKTGQGNPEILMRKLELQYGIESPQAYILNL
jgi:hypothetical protein